MADGNLGAEDFNRLTSEMRPRLHRYCARMIGSPFEGEDLVQEALAKASEAFPTAGVLDRPEAWLFRIAHNVALDAIRRRQRRGEVALVGPDLADPSAAADARVAAEASLAAFLPLTPVERSCVILADVLGYSLEETRTVLGLTLAAAKAALHRGRHALKAAVALAAPPPPISAAERERLRAYADRFNARDFDALRDLLAEDVRLDLANRVRLDGRKDVSIYFTRYDGMFDWRVAAGMAAGRPALLISDPANPAAGIGHVVLLDWAQDRIILIRDYKYAPYVMEGMAFQLLP